MKAASCFQTLVSDDTKPLSIRQVITTVVHLPKGTDLGKLPETLVACMVEAPPIPALAKEAITEANTVNSAQVRSSVSAAIATLPASAQAGPDHQSGAEAEGSL